MDIDVTQDPPVDVFQAKKKYLRIIPYLLGLVVCGILLAVFLVVFGSVYGDILENVALALFVGPGLVFFYFAEKLHDFKALSPQEEREVEEFCQQDPDIAAYCLKVSMMDRRLIKAEYDGFKSRIGEK